MLKISASQARPLCSYFPPAFPQRRWGPECFIYKIHIFFYVRHKCVKRHLSLSLFLPLLPSILPPLLLHVAKFMRRRLPAHRTLYSYLTVARYIFTRQLSRISRPGLCRTLQRVARTTPAGLFQRNFHPPWKIITAQPFRVPGIRTRGNSRNHNDISEKLCIFLTDIQDD